jgi:hypothetical protein
VWNPAPVWTTWRKFFTLQGLELRPLGRRTRSQSLYRLQYSGSCHGVDRRLYLGTCIRHSCKNNTEIILVSFVSMELLRHSDDFYDRPEMLPMSEPSELRLMTKSRASLPRKDVVSAPSNVHILSYCPVRDTLCCDNSRMLLANYLLLSSLGHVSGMRARRQQTSNGMQEWYSVALIKKKKVLYSPQFVKFLN